MMQCEIKSILKCFTLWHLFLLKYGLFAINSSIDTQQFNNHTRRIYSISMYIFQGSMPKHRKWKFSSHINLSIYYFQIYLSKIQVQYWKTHPDPQYLYLMTNVRQLCRFSAGNHHFVKKNIHCIHCVVPENIHTATQREVRGSEVQEIPEGKGVGQ